MPTTAADLPPELFPTILAYVGTDSNEWREIREGSTPDLTKTALSLQEVAEAS